MENILEEKKVVGVGDLEKGRAAPIKTNINSHRVFAADDVAALQPTNVFLLEVDLLNLRFLHEDHRPTQVEIPYRSVRVWVCFCIYFVFFYLFIFHIRMNERARTCHVFRASLFDYIVCVCVFVFFFVIHKICKKEIKNEANKTKFSQFFFFNFQMFFFLG